MIPKKIHPYFTITGKKTEEDNTLIEGILTCCNSHEFEVRIAGENKTTFFSGMHLFPIDDKLALDVCCKKCGRVIPVFYSEQDGYERIGKSICKSALTQPICCRRCKDDTFSVEIRYEYPDPLELLSLGIIETDNAFTWIWITLECRQCGRRYNNFVDFETT